MSDLKIIKKKLLRENKIDRIFEAMGCQYIKYNANRIEAQLPQRFNSDNKRSVQCKLNDSLSCSIRSRPDFGGGDIYYLVSYIVHDKRGEDEYLADLHEAKRFICETLGWNEYLEGGNYKTKIDYLSPLRALQKDRRSSKEIQPNPVLPEQILEEFLPYPYYGWIEEGISYKTQKMYGIGFDLESKRITIPMRNRFEKLIGVKGRLISENDEEYYPKYLYLYKCNISQEWFNFHFAHPYILMDKKVIIVESEKSCMKFASLDIWNTLAICSSDISEMQVNIIKQLGLDIEIYLAFDKDKSAEEVGKQAKKFKGRNIYGIIDTENLLREKDSPIDSGLEVWEKLYNNCCFKIDI